MWVLSCWHGCCVIHTPRSVLGGAEMPVTIRGPWDHGQGVELIWDHACRLAGGVHQSHLRVFSGHASAGPGRRRVRPAHCHQHLLSGPTQRAGAQPCGGAAAALRGGSPLLHTHQAATGMGAAIPCRAGLVLGLGGARRGLLSLGFSFLPGS